MFTDVVEVAEGLSEGHAVDCLGRLASVLEMNSKIRATSLGRLARVDRRCCVADHCWRGWQGETKLVIRTHDFQKSKAVSLPTTLP